jgi:hypothetical protein
MKSGGATIDGCGNASRRLQTETDRGGPRRITALTCGIQASEVAMIATPRNIVVSFFIVFIFIFSFIIFIDFSLIEYQSHSV